jgi:hypothetical protein
MLIEATCPGSLDAIALPKIPRAYDSMGYRGREMHMEVKITGRM